MARVPPATLRGTVSAASNASHWLILAEGSFALLSVTTSPPYPTIAVDDADVLVDSPGCALVWTANCWAPGGCNVTLTAFDPEGRTLSYTLGVFTGPFINATDVLRAGSVAKGEHDYFGVLVRAPGRAREHARVTPRYPLPAARCRPRACTCRSRSPRSSSS